jgi:hypothetical protein
LIYLDTNGNTNPILIACSNPIGSDGTGRAGMHAAQLLSKQLSGWRRAIDSFNSQQAYRNRHYHRDHQLQFHWRRGFATRSMFVGIMPGGEAPGLGRTVLSHPFPIVSKTGVNVTCCI